MKVDLIKDKKISKLVKGDNILDVGCFLNPNPYLKGYVIGCDIRYMETPKNYLSFFQIDLNKENIQIKDKYFDSIILGDVIEHLENPSKMLRECFRLLKDDGRLIISTPHSSHYWEIIKNYLQIFKDTNNEHLNAWSVIDFKRLLRLHNFKVRKIYGISFNIPKIPINFWCPHYLLSYSIIYECEK